MEIKAFGLELRKVGSTQTLYREVDRVLSNVNMLDFQRSAVAHSLQNMIQVDQHFDVCAIHNCVKVAQIVIPEERYNIYRAAHCINWNAMLPEYRQNLIAMVLDDFRSILNPENINITTR